MTTFTFSGYGSSTIDGNPVALLPNAELKVVAADGAVFEYTLIGAGEGIPQIAVRSGAYNITFNGHDLESYPAPLDLYIGTVTWSGGTTTVLNLVVDTGGNTDETYLLRLDGDPFPEITSLQQAAELEASVTGLSTPGGALAPDQMILWTELDAAETSSRDRISGTSASEAFSGGAGRDVIFGRAGHDILEGGGGRDRLLGGNGSDTLEGGAGNDILTGGNHGDTFVFARKFGDDVIRDFNANSNAEKIDLSGVRWIKNMRDLRNNHVSQEGDDVVIDDRHGNTITLEDVALADLGARDFIF
ncbi:calcium-binding protein [Leisingera sp. ANG-M1]|uniref:calcium-binding protein n=1 Tax=Leisingera sp. ANG-M1 TaxID=1577895 RepID=UPI000B0E98FB|nr:hypothetical protein [Leisingera sp. ANG-M1]